MKAANRELRGFVDADLPALIDLWVAAWTATGFAIDFNDRRAWIDERLRMARANGDMIIVGLDAAGRAAGFVTIAPSAGYLDQLCVTLAERGSGLAVALLDEAKRRSPGVVDLDVNESNARARRFYGREGFSMVGRGFSPHSGLPTLKLRWLAKA